MNDRSDPERRGVYSDTAHLETVLLHMPSEGEWIFDPLESDRLLVDGPLDYFRIKEEFREFLRIVRLFGTQVYLIEDMMVDLLTVDASRREKILDELIAEGWLKLDSKEKRFLLNQGKVNNSTFVEFVLSGFYPASRRGFKMYPLVNIMFTRDIMAVVQDKVFWSFNRAKKARQRESFIVRDLVRNHPAFSHLQDVGSETMVNPSCTIEGGDIMPLNDNLVLVGYCSEPDRTRTSAEGVRHIARYLIPEGCAVLVVEFTKHQSRNTIHLDTLLTFASEKNCLCYQPMFDANHSGQVGLGYYLLQSEEDIEEWPRDDRNFFEILSDFELRTASALEKKGFGVVPSKEIQNPDDFTSPMLITLPVFELVSARGGPHCLSMPIQRKR